jgi:GYF domain 2
MLYHISRNGQNYGPYTLEDLQRYVASGNILLTDLAKSDDMAEWVPVSQVLGIASTPLAAPNYPYQQTTAYPAANPAIYPDAPNLHWGLVLLFSFFTCSLFMWVWNLVLSAWMKRVQPASKAILFYVAATVLTFCQIVFNTHTHTMVYQPGIHWWVTYYTGHPLRNLLGLAVWVVRIVARFTMRSELEQHFNGAEPVGLSLSGVMTFFFGGIYFQYHLNRINELKRMARYRGAAI